MLTGVSKFSKVSLFSGLNNLATSPRRPYSAICGYTEADLDQVFAPELDGLDRDRSAPGTTATTGPASGLQPLRPAAAVQGAREFRPWWFETGSPRFLIDLLLIDGYLGTLPTGRDALQDGLYDCLERRRPGRTDRGHQAPVRRRAWRNFIHQDLPETEGYYASVLYAFFASLNAEVIPEDTSNRGQVDLTVKLAGYIYVHRDQARCRRAPPPGGRRGESRAGADARPRLQRQVPRPAEQGADRAGAGLRSAGERNLVRADWAIGGLRATGSAVPVFVMHAGASETFAVQALPGRDPIGYTHRQQWMLRVVLLQCRQARSASEGMAVQGSPSHALSRSRPSRSRMASASASRRSSGRAWMRSPSPAPAPDRSACAA
jgi:hypothetical protein